MRFPLLISILIYCSSFLAQAPTKISYQAVIRNTANALVVNQQVGLQISILQYTSSGNPVYVETHQLNTNSNALISLQIGGGNIVSGDMGLINWEDGPYFIKTETDPSGGTNYSITGVTQLLSVPYALHATTTDSLVGGIIEQDPIFSNSIANGITAADTANWNNHTIDTDTQLTETEVDAFANNNGYLTTEVDGSITNEIQALSMNGDTVFLSNGGSIVLPLSVDTANAIQLINGWQEFGTGYTPKVYLDRERVYLSGLISNGFDPLLGTIPVGYRPTTNAFFICASNLGATNVKIFTSGEIIISSISGIPGWISFEGISFRK